jgi:hypothetical protein
MIVGCISSESRTSSGSPMQNPGTAWCRGFVISGTGKCRCGSAHCCAGTAPGVCAAEGWALRALRSGQGAPPGALACPGRDSAEKRLQGVLRGFCVQAARKRSAVQRSRCTALERNRRSGKASCAFARTDSDRQMEAARGRTGLSPDFRKKSSGTERREQRAKCLEMHANSAFYDAVQTSIGILLRQ